MAGLAILAIEMVIFCWWGSMLASRFSLTHDFAIYFQSTFLIARGQLNPSSLFEVRLSHVDGEFFFWLLAIPIRVWPHFETLKWLQAGALVAAQVLAFGWICEIAASHTVGRPKTVAPIAVAALGLLMLIANPWFAWAVSFDVHSEPFALPFVIATAYNSYRGRTARAWIWAILACCGWGAVSSSYISAVGLSLVLSGRPWWRQGIALTVASLAWQTLLRDMGLDVGATLTMYSQFFTASHHTLPADASLLKLVVAVLSHPALATSTVWGYRANIWAVLSPSGVVGALWPPVLVPTVLVLAEGALGQYVGFSLPSFQNIVLAPLVAVGTVTLLLTLFERLRGSRRWIGFALVGTVAVNAAMWAAIWLPPLKGDWLRVPQSSAHALSRIGSEMASSDEVVASEGVVGGFSNRQYLYSVAQYTWTVPIKSPRVWFVLTPKLGIEQAPVGPASPVISNLLRLPGMRLMAHSQGVWAMRWDVPTGVTELSTTPRAVTTSSSARSAESPQDSEFSPTSPRAAYTIPAWTVAGVSGHVVWTGGVNRWHVVNDGHVGYVVDGADWREPAGNYNAAVTLDANGNATIEAWDQSSREVLARRYVSETDGRLTVRFTVDISNLAPQPVYAGWGIWRILPIPAQRGDTIELRVWTDARAGQIKVFNLSLG